MIFNNTSHIGILQKICQWANVYKYLRLSLYCENISNTAIFWLENEKKAKKYLLNIADCGASLVVQRLRIRLPMQGTWVWALVREDPTCRRAAKPMRHNYWACALEPATHNYWSSCSLEPVCCNCWALVLQLLKPACLEPVLCNKRSHRNEKPVHCNEE